MTWPLDTTKGSTPSTEKRAGLSHRRRSLVADVTHSSSSRTTASMAVLQNGFRLEFMGPLGPSIFRGAASKGSGLWSVPRPWKATRLLSAMTDHRLTAPGTADGFSLKADPLSVTVARQTLTSPPDSVFVFSGNLACLAVKSRSVTGRTRVPPPTPPHPLHTFPRP